MIKVRYIIEKIPIVIFGLLYSILIFNVLVCGPVAGSGADDSPEYYEHLGKSFCWQMLGPWYIAFFLLVVPSAFVVQEVLFPKFGEYLSNMPYTWIAMVNILASITYPLITLLALTSLIRLFKFTVAKILSSKIAKYINPDKSTGCSKKLSS